MNRLAVYSTIHLQLSFFAILKVGSLSKYFSLDQGVWITAFTTGLKIKTLKYWSRVITFGLSENFTDFLECCQASTWSALPGIPWIGGTLWINQLSQTSQRLLLFLVIKTVLAWWPLCCQALEGTETSVCVPVCMLSCVWLLVTP